MTATLAPKTAAAERPSSLLEIIGAVPEHCFERSTARALGLVARDVVLYAAVITALALTNTWWLLVPLWLFAGLIVSGLFVLAHDAAHEAFFPTKRLNDIFGRALMLPSLHLCGAWKLGHNHIHHRHTARQGMDFVWHPVTPDEYAAKGRLARMRHRLEWSAFGHGHYYMTSIWWSKMIALRNPPERFAKQIRQDRWLVGSFFVLSSLGAAVIGGLFSGNLVGAVWTIVKLIIVPFLLFCFSIGWTVYVHHIGPDVPWAKRREWDKVRAQLETTTVLRAPAIMRPFYHSIFVHTPHHVDTRIPCYHLVEAAEAIKDRWPSLVIDEKLTVRRWLRSTSSCKLFDFETGRWHTYRSARAAA
jgi:acyl-lipid omega-6 desaturase (Delta-12 desaturase)